LKTLYFDLGTGAAGDMLSAALLELVPDPEAALAALNDLGIPGVTFVAEKTTKMGVTGTRMHVIVNGEEEGEEPGSEHGYEHEHEHAHGHHHHSFESVEKTVKAMSASDDLKNDVLSVYRLIADAESRVHGVPVEEIHFHEVGAMDAIADVAAACYLMDLLELDEIVASVVHTGFGTVRCAHGVLPVPAPATAILLEGVPMTTGRIEGELLTPTGAALLRHFVTRFGDMPDMTVEKIGYGFGKKDFQVLTAVRVFLGESTEDPEETILELSCNVDDMTAEEVAFAMERLFEAGAMEVYTVAIGMKKSRPGTLLRAMCRPEQKAELVKVIFKYTSTLGVRETVTRRNILSRHMEEVETPYGPVRKKVSSGYGVTREKYEYEDVARIAREQGLSPEEVKRLLP